MEQKKNMKKCQVCKNNIANSAEFCPYCGNKWKQEEKLNSSTKKANYRCSNCHNILQKGDTFCSKCGGKILSWDTKNKCQKCGNVIQENQNFCAKCGEPAQSNSENILDNNTTPTLPKKDIKKYSVASAFFVLSIIIRVVVLLAMLAVDCTYGNPNALGIDFLSLSIPFLWIIPMYIHLKNCIEFKQSVTLSFKICTLLFVSTIGGIILLCTDENTNEDINIRIT